MKKAVERYENVAGAKVNFDKSEGWVLGGVAFPCQGPSTGMTSQGRSACGYLVSKAVVLKGQSRGVCRVHLPLDPLPVVRTPSA